MFYGVSSTELGQIHLVFELMELRSLAALLESDTPLPWPQRQQFAAELARGMQHLHGLGMIHRDLKSDNCLVSADMHAKVRPHSKRLEKHDYHRLFCEHLSHLTPRWHDRLDPATWRSRSGTLGKAG